jgi:hypothetical protein
MKKTKKKVSNFNVMVKYMEDYFKSELGSEINSSFFANAIKSFVEEYNEEIIIGGQKIK